MKRGKPASGGGSSKKVEKPITSFFFKQPSPAKAPAAKPSVVDDDEKASASPPSKRRRGSDEEPPAAPVTQKPPTPGKPEEDAPAMDAPATATRYAPAVAAVTAAALASIAPSQPDRHDRFVRKLALDHRRRDGTNRGGAEGEDGATGGGPTGAQNAGIEPGDEPAPREGSRYARRPGAPVSTSASSPGGSSSKAPLKMTPLEEQVRRHKAEHPGVVLLIEVGYKFHFYGEDARVAAKTLNIFAYQSRNYLTASVPVPRLHVYVRRLVDAGHKVGVIRQTETAALKAAGEYAGNSGNSGKSGSGEASGKSGLFERKLVGLYTKSTLEAGVAVDPGGGAHNAVAGASAADGDWRTTGVLLCVAESFDSAESATSTRIGLAAVDASAGDVRYAEFDDGPARPGLESRLLQLSPAEVLLVEPVSAATNALVAAVFGEGKGARVERIAAESGYADARDAERALARYVEPRTSSENENENETLASFSLDENEKRKTSVKLPGGQTARAAATAFDWLRPFGLDGVSRLVGSAAAFKPMAGGDDDGGTMRLSPNVIRQLELFRSSEDTHRGSLVWLLGANAITAGGARLVRRWVAHPLTSVRAIRERLDAVRELAETAEPDSGGRLDALPAALRRCHGAGDAERYLARVFHGTATPAELVTALSAVRAFAGAVAEMAQKSLQTNRDALEGPSGGSASPCASLLLRRLLAEASDEEVAATCESLLSAVDAEAARSGRATPATALKPDAARFPELEKTRAAVAEAVRDLEGLLPELREQLIRGGARGSDGAAGADGAGSPPFTKKKKTLPAASRAAIPATLGYVTVALVEHLIELPDTAEGVPHDWVRVSTNKSKKVVRYHPPAVLARAAALERARERHARACEAAWRHFLSVECAGKFLELRAATRAAAGLDSLCSLAALARQEGYCCPTFLDDADKSDEGDENELSAAFLDIREGRHPVLDATLAGGERVVPNSVRLGTRFPGTRKTSASAMTETNGGDEGLAAVDALAEPPTGSRSENPQNPRALVVTGPNMGGKSCFVRQTALLALMAQCGSFVPARAMTLTAFEGVHTRMGAADNLAMGSSTFLEEMSECAAILRAAAAEKRSLVVLDELGRGTSTHDGVAVAHATLEHLVGGVGGSSASDGSCSGSGTLTLFVTHYPSVARDVVAKRPDACAAAFTSYAEKRFLKKRLEPGAEAADAAYDAYAAADEIDFLYALTPGVAHRSFGLNVARMAGVPPGVLRCAAAKARELETGMAKKAAARAAREARRDGGAGGDGERTLLGACEEIAEASRAVVRALRDAGDVDAVATAQARARDATSRREKK